MSYQDCLAEEYMHCFPDTTLIILFSNWCYHFNIGLDLLPVSSKEQAIKLKCDSDADSEP